jgi:dihydroxy-acid dehydratase
MLRSQPIDGVVLMGGCDKTTPGLLMGAFSVDLPTIYLPTGPMLRGNWKGDVLGSGSDAWKYWAEKRAGNLSDQEWCDIESGIARSPGHCMTMGTASTMTSIVDALGLIPTGASSIPAVDSNHSRLATDCGRLIVEMVWADLRPSKMISYDSFENAITTDMAIGGSTNAILHLIAMAGRAGIKLELADFDRISRRTPVIANIRPSGEYLMEDFYYAGGLKGLLRQIKELLHLDCLTVTGQRLGDTISDAEVHNDKVIRTLENPVDAEGSTAILKGNLAPDGAVIKTAAADKRLLKHTGRAIVFSDYRDLKTRIDDLDLDVDENSVLILQNAGPQGAPGMPEWGMLPIPKKLLEKGVRDMVRISDCRMSGTSYGTCILHVAPESSVGGPLGLVRTGDMIELDVDQRSLNVQLSSDEMKRRRQSWKPRESQYERGYLSLYLKHVSQANEGCDFDFLQGRGGVPEPEIF